MKKLLIGLLFISGTALADSDDWIAPFFGGVLFGNAIQPRYVVPYPQYIVPPPPVYYAPQYPRYYVHPQYPQPYYYQSEHDENYEHRHRRHHREYD